MLVLTLEAFYDVGMPSLTGAEITGCDKNESFRVEFHFCLICSPAELVTFLVLDKTIEHLQGESVQFSIPPARKVYLFSVILVSCHLLWWYAISWFNRREGGMAVPTWRLEEGRWVILWGDLLFARVSAEWDCSLISQYR